MDLKTIKKAGFKSKEELQLYRDVCATDFPLYTDVDETNFSKNDFEKYIKEHDLSPLLDKVKDLPELERLVEIHMYYYDMDIEWPEKFADKIIKSIQAKRVANAKKYIAEIRRIRQEELRQQAAIMYVTNQAYYRLGKDNLAFFCMIDKRMKPSLAVRTMQKVSRRR